MLIVKMTICCVFGCHNKPEKVDGVTFHRFPANQPLKDQWIKAVRRKNWTPNKWSKVCSIHFDEKDIDRTSLMCVRLRENAVPCVFPSFPKHLQIVKQSRKPPPICHQATAPSTTSTEEITPSQVTSACSKVNVQPPSPPPADINSCGTPRKFDLTIKLDKACRKLDYAHKKLKVLGQQNRRLKKRNAMLNDMISTLKEEKSLEDDHLRILKETCPGIGGEILMGMCRQKSRVSESGAYSTELRAFAMTLHHYSPRAYAYVRKTFDKRLPHPQTMQKWCRTADDESDLTSESPNFIKHVQADGISEQTP